MIPSGLAPKRIFGGMWYVLHCKALAPRANRWVALLHLVSTIRRVRQRKYLGWAISLAALSICLLLRIAIHDYGDGLAAGMLMPAVMIAALFGGMAEGLFIFGLASFLLFFLFIPPYFTFEVERNRDIVSLLLFMTTGLIALYLIQTLNKAVDTSHKLAEQAKQMQRRTAILFAELQHRVANNLAFLTAVLDQQAGHFNREGPVGLAVAAIKDRLMAMSRSHRRLYDPQRINEPIGGYLAELCAEQISASGLPITHSVQCDAVVLELDQLVPVALIVSELITNSLKHAFKGRPNGNISVRIKRCETPHDVELVVSDDGIGLASSPTGHPGIGRRIITGLAAQSNSQVIYTNGAGTTATLRFVVEEEKASHHGTCRVGVSR